MHLTSPFVRLPLQFDAERLAQEIADLPETAWKPHPHGYPGNAAVPLVAAHGDPGDDRTSGEMRPTPHLAALPYVRQVMAALQVPVGRTRLMRIDGNGEATRHVDTNYYWQTHVRIHVPVQTTANVVFECGESRVHMRAGECWIFDTWSAHNVLNPDPTRRIHLVIDSVGSEPFWARVAAGDRPTELHPPAFPNPVAIPFDPALDAQPPYERFNQPLVMSPGEVAHWFDLATTAARTAAASHPEAVRALAHIARDFGRAWSAAYAEFGPMAHGHAHYRQLLQGLDRSLDRLPAEFAAPNGVRVAEIVRQLIVRVALNPDLGLQYQQASTPALAAKEAAVATAPATPALAPIAAVPAVEKTRRRFDRPVFIVSPPRSGSSLLFETLVQSPTAWSIGGESHRLIEQIPALNPASVAFESNRIGADKATAMTVAELVHGFFGQVRDREGRRAAADATDLRLVEKTPKNALRVPFLATAFDDARFLVLHREPRDVLSSMLDAWRSGRFVTYPALPGWQGAPWSLVLTPGWRQWVGLPVHEIVARQWQALVDTLLDDLEAIDPERIAVSEYADLLHDPNAEVRQLCVRTGLGWDRDLSNLPLSRHTLTPPDPDKWKRNADEVQAMLAIVRPTAERFAAFARRHRGTPAGTTQSLQPVAPVAVPAPAAPAVPAVPKAPVAGKEAAAASKQAFGSVFTGSMSGLVAQTGGTLVVTTYQSGRTILVRNDQGSINTHFKAFHSPMGVAYDRQRLALATGRSVIEMHNHVGVAETLQPPGKHDACFVPRNVHYTGDIRIHEIGFAQNELWIVNTRFSCLATLDGVHNFVPRWKPRFISAIEPGDRCHLNGMCIIDDRVRFVSALAATDTPGGWREHKADGGLLIDVDSNEVVARGLSMPHSPRWYDGRLWILESGKGALSTIDLATGQASVVCELPGFTRGLAFHGPYAFIGLSQIRESVFGGLPIVERLTERLCGVWAVDLRSGRIAGFLRFEGAVQEIFDVQLLPGLRFPELFEPEDERLASAFVLPNAPRPAVRPAA